MGYHINKLPFSSLILIEPGFISPEMLERVSNMGIRYETLITMAKTRKDTWPSREAARVWISTRLPWKFWTPRSLDLFVVRVDGMHVFQSLYPSVCRSMDCATFPR